MPRLLLVEDNEMNRDMLTRRLQRRGYEVVVALDGAEAIARARSESPDLILLDMSLPVIDGWEAARRMKADAATCRIPVIALTAHAMAGDREKALAAGCDDFDTKPIDLQRLLGKIEKRLGKVDGTAAAVASRSDEPLVLTCLALLQNLPALQDMAGRACGRAHVDDEDVYAIRLAVEEVFSNIVQHGYPPGRPGFVTFAFAVDAHEMRITVEDEASPFSPHQAPVPDLAADVQARAIGGLGWHLVFRLMDEVRHEVRRDVRQDVRQDVRHEVPGASGNRLVLVKRFSEPPRSGQ